MDNCESSYRRYLQGDDHAFSLLVDACYDPLVLFINSYVHDLNFAEDIAEDTFVRLAVKKPRFDNKSSFKTWLYSIARKVMTDKIRKAARHKTASLDECAEPTAEDDDIERNYIKKERDIALHRAMLQLKPEYRAVLWLFYFEDMKTENIAKSIGKSEDAAEHLLRRARQALKQILDKEGFDYEGT